MGKRRFLFASVDAPPKTGGVAYLAWQLSNTLARDFSDESVFVGPQGTLFGRGERHFKLVEDFQSETKLRAGPGCSFEDQRIEDLFDRIIASQNCDTLILWHPFYYGVGGIRAAQKNGIQSYVFVHGTELTSQFPELISSTQAGKPMTDPESLPARLRYTLEAADCILTNSGFTAELVKRVVGDKPVISVGCGLDQALIATEAERQPGYSNLFKQLQRERIGLPERKTLIHVGRMVPHKNQEASIELISHMPEAQLVLVGDGPHRRALEEKASNLGVKDRVFFAGEVDDATKWSYLRASDIGLLVSRIDQTTGGYEGFGIVLLEYAAAGCVPFTNGEAGMADFGVRFDAAIIGLNDPEKPIQDEAMRLSQILFDDVEMNARLEKARLVMSQRYTWQEVAERVAEIGSRAMPAF